MEIETPAIEIESLLHISLTNNVLKMVYWYAKEMDMGLEQVISMLILNYIKSKGGMEKIFAEIIEDYHHHKLFRDSVDDLLITDI